MQFSGYRFGASFPKYTASKPYLSQISKYLTSLKIRAEILAIFLSPNEGQTSSLPVEVLDLRHITPFQNHNASNVTARCRKSRLNSALFDPL